MRFLVILAALLAMIFLGCDSDDNDTGTNGGGGEDTIVDSNPDPTKNVSVVGIEGLSNEGTLNTGQEIVISLKILNNTGSSIKGMTNGFRVYSPDGVFWTSTSGDTTGTVGKDMFDLVANIGYFSADGRSADTVGFGFAVMTAAGMSDGFDEVGWTITVGPISSSYAGKHICIDSTYYPPSGLWLWADDGGNSFEPTWDGPHCWEIGD